MINPIKKRTILCVDDDPDDLVLLKEAVADAQQTYCFIEARNGKEALAYLQLAKQTAEFPCLIILDINMPILNGKETLQMIKSDDALKNIPAVVFTTSSNSEDKLFCSSFSTDMISKPVYFEELRQTVQRLLGYCAPVPA